MIHSEHSGYRDKMLTMLIRYLLILSLYFCHVPSVNSSCATIVAKLFLQQSPIAKYAKDTVNGLSLMRGLNGLLVDKIQILPSHRIKVLNAHTSPSNVALDILVQLELLSSSSHLNAKKNLEKILETLNKIEFHKESGLFFSWYNTDLSSLVADRNVSSIDNLHLALALFTVSKSSDPTLASKARSLFKRMNFSIFYEPSSHLIGGNLRYGNETWVREAYNFSNAGSEARSLYSIGWALDLFGPYSKNSDFVTKGIEALDMEIYQSSYGNILKLWDGGGFQLLLPKLLIGEDIYSPQMKQSFEAYGQYIISEGKRRRIPLPTGHSACGYAIDSNLDYNGKAGNLALVSEKNHDVFEQDFKENWDNVVSPHILVMAATTDPKTYIPILKQAEMLGDGDNALYAQGLGWLDAIHVTGESRGKVVPVQLSLDQGMIALSTMTPTSISARALYDDIAVRKKLEMFYRYFDQRFERSLYQRR